MMINIEERLSEKLPIKTSLFVKLNFFDKYVFDTLVQEPSVVYNNITKEFETPITKLYFLVSLLTKYSDVSFSPWESVATKKIDVTNDFKVPLFKHQLESISYGLTHNGWLLLDEPGLGKTAQMICLAEKLKQKENIEHCLIICGVNSLKTNWLKETSIFSNLSARILGQVPTKTGYKIGTVAERLNELIAPIDEFFVITNLETLQSKDFVKAFRKSKNKFGMIVLDEAHKAKSPSSQSGKTLLKLQSPHNIALTGTLILSEPENAYVSLKWTGNIKCGFTEFKHTYNVYGGYGGVKVIGHKNLDLLSEKINSCSLRRKKDEVLDLPEQTYEIEYVEMGSQQEKLYKEVSEKIANELNLLPEEQHFTLMQEMTMNMRLRQITAFPGILTDKEIPSAKLDRMEELVEEIISQGNKVIVYATFTPTIAEIQRRLSKWGCISCTGGVSDQQLSNLKEQFQEDRDTRVFALTWEMMGTGHTLISANYVIFIDTPWTAAEMQQSADRVHRIGQSKNVHIITLVTKDTYDERVLELVSKKGDLSEFIIGSQKPSKKMLVDPLEDI